MVQELYEEDYVKTAAGWRMKKRVFTGDAVVGNWRPLGSACDA